jgi:hypothetical protein
MRDSVVLPFLKRYQSYGRVIMSGRFGCGFMNYVLPHASIAIKCWTVNGGLRKGEPIISLQRSFGAVPKLKFLFIDDSFYEGRTRLVISNELERCGHKLVDTYVLYDGCSIKQPNVRSLFRYHNVY